LQINDLRREKNPKINFTIALIHSIIRIMGIGMSAVLADNSLLAVVRHVGEPKLAKTILK
jgi:hypothetical protein